MTKLFIPLIVLWMNINPLSAQNLTVMTYNIRLDLASDGENAWPNRKEMVCNLLLFHEPDVFGVQEALPHQIGFIDSTLIEYSFVGLGRDGGNNGEHSSIFYKNNRFDVIQQSTFWLSETPDTISLGWDAAFKRICTYALFNDKETHKKFWVFNLHLDHMGSMARIQGVKQVIETINKLNVNNYPIILMGDFNATPESEPIQFIEQHLVDSKKTSRLVYGNGATFNGFRFHEMANECIDYIFISQLGFNVTKYAVLTDSNNQHYPSDHFPVMVQLDWK